MDFNARQALFERLLALPGAVTQSVLDDVLWAWSADPNAHGYIDKLQLIQNLGVYPDIQARLVRFNATLLVRAFPILRSRFADICALRPMTFSGRPQTSPLQLVVSNERASP